MENTKSGLLQILESQSSCLDPEPTGLTQRLPLLEGIRALIFDIYGTLFVSGSGDISLAQEVDRDSVLLSVLGDAGVTWPQHDDVSAGKAFTDLIRASHARARSKGVDYPEVEIREIWRDLLRMAGALENFSTSSIEK